MVLADDIDGTLQATHCVFTWGGVEYTIDLAGGNLDEFRDWESVARKWVKHGHVAKKPKRTRQSTTEERGYDIDMLRKWAESRGITIPRAGRIPRATIDRYLGDTGDGD